MTPSRAPILPLIADVLGGLANQPGDPNRSTIFTGPQGSGKTVLLSAISDIASQQGWVGTRATARGGMIDMVLACLQAFIPQIEVEEAMLRTIEENGRSISPSALAAAAKATGGFAFSIQLIGYYLWRITDDIRPISEEDVRAAIELSEAEMERAVFAPTLRELTPREVGYLQAMAADDGPSTTSEVARRMEISMTNASNVRRRLIEHGVISEVRLGQVQFEIPLLRDYLKSHKL